MRSRWFIPVLLLAPVVFGACEDTNPTAPVATGIALQSVASGLTSPVAMVEPPDGTHRLFIVDQTGVIRILGPDGTLMPEPFLDLRDEIVTLMPEYDERGLLGLAFAPDYSTSGRFFVYYTAPPRGAEFDNTSTLSEFRVSADPNRADPASERILLQADHPQFNHDAGTLAFGPDGYLYISIGDGGGGGDIGFGDAQGWVDGDHRGHVPDWYEGNAGGNGQDVAQNLMGNVLRIDVSQPGTYTIPPDNPFVDRSGLDEIYAYGFRNPYRFTFDRLTGALILGDAGQDMWEEVDVVQKGGNYGWNVKEGTHCFDTADFMNVPASCPSVDPETGDPLIDPVIEMPNYGNPLAPEDDEIVVVVGGYVYRGASIPELQGRYVFGAFTSEELEEGPAGKIFVADPGAGMWNSEDMELENVTGENLGRFILGFAEDQDGELYVLTTRNAGPAGSTGEVFKLVPAEDAQS
ncbi:MAG TPA: PQQ-dependent sugar dehydrogenase [Longimicrobiaceae bacterium]|nr:PQQ-dependent sugar dehydrogenase [Longimicrobiaceae bacterium]